MQDVKLQEISTYTMKLRLYPSKAQQESIDRIFRALHIAYNITFHEVFQKNPQVCSKPNKDGAVWPDYSKMVKAEWRQFLIQQNPAVADAPAASLMNKNGLFLLDGKRAWKTGMNNRPVEDGLREEFRFYNAKKPRRSFFVQIPSKNLQLSEDNDKVAWIQIPKVGRIKARGFNRKLRFGKDGCFSYENALLNGILPKDVSARISCDPCGDYFISLTFTQNKKDEQWLYLETKQAECREPIGIDVGIKDIATLSTGDKVENKHFKREKQEQLSRLNKALSRRWGPSNMAFRDYNKNVRQNNQGKPPEEREPMAKPGNRYLKTQKKKSRLERRAARQRQTYYQQQTAKLIQKSSMIAVETLLVTNMMRNHKLAYALSDAAMSKFIEMLKYKAERYGVPVRCIGMFEASSQICHACGEKNPRVKNLQIRSWVCPQCGSFHDRDINAAKNILQIAEEKGGVVDEIIKKQDGEKPSPAKKRKRGKDMQVFSDSPDVVVTFSKELTKRNDPRYVIINKNTHTILDDAQGYGYRSASNAKNCYKAKLSRNHSA